MLHVGSAIGLLIYFWRTWVELIKAFFVSLARMIRQRRWALQTRAERLAWLIVTSTIPTGILGLALEHPARTATAKPLIAAIFLVVNGGILLGAERLRRRAEVRALARREGRGEEDRELTSLSYPEAAGLGVVQAGGLIAGISRDGVVMAGGLGRGLDNSDAGYYSFLLATPIILAAGIFKFSDLTGPLGRGVRGPAVIAAVVAAIFAIITVHFLSRYLKRGNLIPFGIYCVLFGAAMIGYNA
jgi:undecaprenyl-diphosphatase